MSLAAAKPALKAALLNLSQNTNPDKTPEESVDAFLDALETWVKAATITVPGTGLVAPSGGGPVTGSSITGSLT